MHRLVVEPRYPWQINGVRFRDEAQERDSDQTNWDAASEAFRFSELDPDTKIHFVNGWYSAYKRCDVCVYHIGDGRSRVAYLRSDSIEDRVNMSVTTLAAVAEKAWSTKAESAAMSKLRDLVSANAFACYSIAGQFLETSPRSGVTYIFRRCRPTLAIVQRPPDLRVRVLSALCLHPIGYYDHTFAGVMVPTDDVIAHLLMMRGDERKFWSKANHHPLHSAAAGI